MATHGAWRLPAPLRDEIIRHAQQHPTKEVCGIIAGTPTLATKVFKMRNVEDSPIGYALDPREQLQVMQAMRAAGWDLLAVYHSHTATPAELSPVDITHAYPDMAYMVVSLQRDPPVLNVYRIGAGGMPEPVNIQMS